MSRQHWAWEISSYRGDKLMMTTRHADDVSRDMELAAIRACGRRAVVAPLSDEARKKWNEGWRP